ncbi:MAG TPA: PIG-L family deacetylase [Verrucomicrobiae bacterium]|jgi:LmbE family N-acetylglucosaminyl deacetylase|nr:PIG-L family deacetylase [Verrucomicrobiae bacterium]
MNLRKAVFFCALICGLFFSRSLTAQVSDSSQAILHDLQSFRQMGSVLYVAAHPDDENNELIAYLARGRDYRTAYMSLTRGDGGQNVLGPDFGEKLGVARTQELLAARRVDGGRQYFSRAVDFGFSKDYRETLGFWDKQGVLSDIVRVIRTFRPDVMITRFSTIPGGTHGHHTASAILALEAFKLAGDPKAFPEQLGELTPWQPTRILWNGSSFESGKNGTNAITINAGGKDPVTGESFSEIAARSRSMHKTQGLGGFRGRNGDGPRTERFQLLAGSPVTNDILDGIDPTWSRVSGGTPIRAQSDQIIAQFNPQSPSASVPALLELRSVLSALPVNDPVVAEKRAQLDHIIQSCLGLEFTTSFSPSEVVPGEKINVSHSAIIHSSVPVRWVAVRYPGIKGEARKGVELHANQSASLTSTETLPAGTPLTEPYWLRNEGTVGMSRVDDPSLIGRPENPSAFPIEQVFEVGGQTITVPDDSARLDVIPPVWLHFVSDIALLTPGTSRSVAVEITASRAGAKGDLRLDAPTDWKISPSKQSFHLAKVGEHAQFEFTITAPSHAATAKIIASAEVGGVRYQNQHEVVSYPHFPRQLLQPLASTKALSVDLATRGHTVGYLPGAGDSLAENLQQMGYSVTLLDDNLTPEKLRGLDAIVIGVRAYNVRTNIASELPALFAYAENGGTVIAQYNRPTGLLTSKLAPYELHLSGERVTDETAAVTFLAPEHPVLNTPNKITDADFSGWIQERGIYFPDRWDDHFIPILACHDSGESPLKGSLLVAQYGKGYFVYTGLVFFRELPAGVPGAYRLFANLISLGK